MNTAGVAIHPQISCTKAPKLRIRRTWRTHGSVRQAPPGLRQLVPSMSAHRAVALRWSTDRPERVSCSSRCADRVPDCILARTAVQILIHEGRLRSWARFSAVRLPARARNACPTACSQCGLTAPHDEREEVLHELGFPVNCPEHLIRPPGHVQVHTCIMMQPATANGARSRLNSFCPSKVRSHRDPLRATRPPGPAPSRNPLSSAVSQPDPTPRCSA